MFKKCISTLFITSLCSLSAYADGVSPAAFGPKYEFHVGPVWLKPSASNLNYVIFNNEIPAQTPRWYEQEVLPGYTAGFELGMRYFANGGNRDIHLEWIHLNTSDSTSIDADSFIFFLGPDYEIGPDGLPIRHADGKAKFNYDVINLDAGQRIHFGNDLVMRVFGGLSAGFLREEVTAIYSGSVEGEFAGPFSQNQEVSSNFTGLGPRFGVRADFDVAYGFGLLGETAISALFGRVHSKTDFIGKSVELEDKFGQSINRQTIKDQHVYQAIPGIDVKLGAEYKYDFSPQTALMISAGYQASVYINVISQYLPASLVPDADLETGGIFVDTMEHTLSNYSVQGPFLDVAFQIK